MRACEDCGATHGLVGFEGVFLCRACDADINSIYGLNTPDWYDSSYSQWEELKTVLEGPSQSLKWTQDSEA